MKIILPFLLMTTLSFSPAFAEDTAVEYEKLSSEVKAYLLNYETLQLSSPPARKILNQLLDTRDDIQSRIDDPKKHREELKKNARETQKTDGIDKNELKVLLAKDPDRAKNLKDLSQLKNQIKDAQEKFDALEKARMKASNQFEEDFTKFGARERKIRAALASKSKVEADKDKSGNGKRSAIAEPEQLKEWLSTPFAELKKKYLPQKDTSAGGNSKDEAESAENPQNPPPTVAAVSTQAPSAQAPTAAGDNKVVEPAKETPFTTCDDAMAELTKLILEKNSAILSEMVNLASLKMAYHLSPGKNNLNTLEEYANRVKKNMSVNNFGKELKSSYKKYGEAVDQKKAAEIFSRQSKYYDKALRLDNESSSAILLYLSGTAQKGVSDSVKFTPEDAAAVWAQAKIFNATQDFSGMEKHGENSNLLNFSTQVYSLLNDVKDPKAEEKLDRTHGSLQARIDVQQKSIQSAIALSVNRLSIEKQTKCFSKGSQFANCDGDSVKLGSESIKEIQQSLTHSIGKGSKKETGPGAITIDFDKSSFVGGKIDLKLSQ